MDQVTKLRLLVNAAKYAKGFDLWLVLKNLKEVGATKAKKRLEQSIR